MPAQSGALFRLRLRRAASLGLRLWRVDLSCACSCGALLSCAWARGALPARIVPSTANIIDALLILSNPPIFEVAFGFCNPCCRLNWSMQHHLIGMFFLKVVFMAQGKRNRLSAEQRADMWRRWKAGESLHEIGRAFGKGHGSIRFLLTQRGGIVPAVRRRSPRTLTPAEREDISRGIASGSSIREIAKGLQRAASTVSREVARHGGRPQYRASEADSQAWESALRPKT
jgi:hypothetical protein